MSQTTLDENLSIISASDFDITFLDGDLSIIQKLDDEPNDVGGLTSAQLKAKFDESGLIIQKYINQTLIPELLAADAVESARVSAENRRAANEEIRIANESVRNAAEKQRQDSTAGIVAQATAQANEAKRQAQRAEAAASGGNHAARHAADGGDAITPAMIGAAPAGCGLGSGAKLVDSWDDVTTTGFYVSNVSTPTSGYWFGTCSMTVNYTERVQTIHKMINGTLCTCIRHYATATGFTPWEWVNPPLALGTEYRTTQRYMRKPVYQKLLDFGPLPVRTTLTVEHGIGNLEKCLSISGHIDCESYGGENLLGRADVTSVFKLGNSISITTTADFGSGNAYVLLTYTKTTD